MTLQGRKKRFYRWRGVFILVGLLLLVLRCCTIWPTQQCIYSSDSESRLTGEYLSKRAVEWNGDLLTPQSPHIPLVNGLEYDIALSYRYRTILGPPSQLDYLICTPSREAARAIIPRHSYYGEFTLAKLHIKEEKHIGDLSESISLYIGDNAGTKYTYAVVSFEKHDCVIVLDPEKRFSGVDDSWYIPIAEEVGRFLNENFA